MNSLLEKVLKNKEEGRLRLARLPIEEKMRILVKMQKRAYPIIKDRVPRACVWKIA